MQAALLLLGGALAGLYFYNRWGARNGPAQTMQFLRRAGLALLVLLLVLLLIRGGPGALLMLLPILLPLLMRSGLGTLRMGMPGGMGGPTASRRAGAAGAQSQVVTEYLRMTLDHDTGRMSGVVLKGRFEGQRLEALDLDQLLVLWQDCQTDPQSAAVLEAWLDRAQPDWREHARAEDQRTHEAAAHGPMSKDEAYAILGLCPGATSDEIRAAHRRLMQKVHPDHGGSDWLAARLNQAKDLLLGR